MEWAWSCHVTFVCGVGVAMCEGEVMGVVMSGSTVVTGGSHLQWYHHAICWFLKVALEVILILWKTSMFVM